MVFTEFDGLGFEMTDGGFWVMKWLSFVWRAVVEDQSFGHNVPGTRGISSFGTGFVQLKTNKFPRNRMV